MPTIDQILTIAGAAEGSNYSVPGGKKDVRYQPSFANAISGLSFGVFQFDVATNTQAQSGFHDILRQGVVSKKIDKATSDRLYSKASMRNAALLMKQTDKQLVVELLSASSARFVIDALDRQRAQTFGTLIDSIIGKAAKKWMEKKITGSRILTPGQPECLRLFAYLLASLNRFPDNQRTFEQWLQGENVKTQNGPSIGFQINSPPTLEQMHLFFKSLRIWSGSQGNYQYLRDRLDPTLSRIGG